MYNYPLEAGKITELDVWNVFFQENEDLVDTLWYIQRVLKGEDDVPNAMDDVAWMFPIPEGALDLVLDGERAPRSEALANINEA